MKKGLVIYDSLFGNTKKVAFSLAKGLMEGGLEVDCEHIDSIDIYQISSYNFLAIGGPTHMIGLSKAMKAFLQKLSTISVRGITGFSFDTRNESRMNSKKWLVLENSAARRIEGKMKKIKIKIIFPRQSAIVQGREGPLEENAEEIFLAIGREIAKKVHDTD